MKRPFNWLKNNKDKIEYKAETTIFIVFVNFTNMIFFRRVDAAEFLKNGSLQEFPKDYFRILIRIPSQLRLEFRQNSLSRWLWVMFPWNSLFKGTKSNCIWDNHPISFIEYLTQHLVFHVKSHVTKHVFWRLLILKSQHPM